MDGVQALLLEQRERTQLWQQLTAAIEQYLTGVEQAPVAPALQVEALRSLVSRYDFGTPLDPLAVLDQVVDGLWAHQVQTTHPRYFGLFNPAPTTMGIAADALVAAFNPQLAAWSHSPYAAEIERHVLHAFGTRFGYPPADVDGVFASGGAEANHTALLTALVAAFPDFARAGVRGLSGQPVLYASAQSHHSLVKAARFCGLGSDAVRSIATDAEFRIDVDDLTAQIARDRQAGVLPFLIVATAGTTSAGVLDPLEACAAIAAGAGLWLHVDAAWGGLALLVPELRGLLAGIECADSIAFDAHKGLSVPMSAGLYLTRHPAILAETCRVSADYMPREAAGLDIVDPFTHSLQWSRRFIGLKVFLSLAVAGWDGYAAAIRHQVAMGTLLREELQARHWTIVNKTPLPVICFDDASDRRNAPLLEAIAAGVIASGSAWISPAQLDATTPVLRACVTNYRTAPDDVLALVEAVEAARRGASGLHRITHVDNGAWP
jgi:glutamate/tyrosine decarboxylase-like PLP-dependent enzyme